jgi:hypothetical protein
VALNENETIVSEEYLKFFNLESKLIIPGKELHDENLKLNMTFDALAFLLSGSKK